MFCKHWQSDLAYHIFHKFCPTLDISSFALADFYGERMLNLANKTAMKHTLSMTDEQIGFGLDLKTGPGDTLAALAVATGYKLGRYHLMGTAHRKGAFMAIAAFEVGDVPA